MRKTLLSRVLMTGAGTVAAVALAAGTASAHFCYKTEVNPASWEGKNGSQNWTSFAELVAIHIGPVCAEGVDIIADGAGATPTTLINTHGTMAGGTLKKDSPGTKSISYLDFAGLEAAIPAAIAACEA
ncbi:hypothetical protein [Prauserella muralis]|uniref:Uncharacterized protein n=1 Tax=Prauserella muralis TaxID=588067 RepID=A0A2V4BA28_9PSEU|nr:hypothetical protein [Prauserella muralis]PXY31911.1 hypothetical protein BAY60_06175 [Prauserella muralis]TWE13668.1 hypothetical protein FHX69_5793 [Prauserella muralis]